MADTIDIRPGFGEPVIASQQVFRATLEAMARPGRIVALPVELNPPPPLSVASAAVCLALADHETPLWLSPDIAKPAAAAFLRFHCGCPIVDDPAQAAFAIVSAGSLPSLDRFALGDDAWPESSATVIVQVDALRPAGPLTLTGPGIANSHGLAADGLRDGVWDEWAANRTLFPRGIDLLLVAGRQLAALPRTTTVTVTVGEEG